MLLLNVRFVCCINYNDVGRYYFIFRYTKVYSVIFNWYNEENMLLFWLFKIPPESNVI